ncbi:MAG: hydrogenase maturation protease [Bacillota bacterium]
MKNGILNSMGKLRYQVLVLGLGNLLMTDDGFGVLAAQILMQKAWPSGVAVMDIGTAAFYFWEEISLSRHVIAVDALRAGGKPGSIYRLSGADIRHPPDGRRAAHGFTFPDVIALARKISGYPSGLLIYGVEPLDLRFGNPLSPVLKKTLPKVLAQVSGEIDRLL